MTAPKKKTAARKPAAKKPVADPTAKEAAKKAAAESPALDPVEEKREAATRPPGEIPPKAEKPKDPDFLNKRVLSDEDRIKLIRLFNVEFDNMFPTTLKSPKSLESMQRRLKEKKG